MTTTDGIDLAQALTGGLDTAEPQTPVPDAAELDRLALRVAVLGLLADDARARYSAARESAEPVFAAARAHGTRQQAVMLPGGTEAGVLALKAGEQVIEVDENELLMLVATSSPSELEDYAVPDAALDPDALAFLIEQVPDLFELRAGALEDDRLIKLLAGDFPHLVERRIRPARRQEMQDFLAEHDGHIPDPGSGELVKVATVTNRPPAGGFSYVGKTKNTGKIRAALDAGLITVTEAGEVVVTGSATPEGGDQE